MGLAKVVEVYWNLHKRCFSIRDASTKLVIAYASQVMLSSVEFKVSEAGRQRVLRERRKNVHAVVRGTWIRGARPADFTEWSPVVYNPYRAGHFAMLSHGEPIYKASHAYLETWMGKAQVSILVAEKAFENRWKADVPLLDYGTEPDYC